MSELWVFFEAMEWWKTPIYLALLGFGIALPFRALLWFTGFKRQIKARHFVLTAPILEELVFRAAFLSIGLLFFEPMALIVIATAAYTVYMGLVYGPPYAADGLVLGVLFGLAFFELGLATVILAHIFYRAVLSTI